MADLEIIGVPQSNYVWTCAIAATEKGLTLRIVPVRAHDGEAGRIHPFGKIPCMRHGDFTLWESRAILSYIDHAFPGPALAPRDPKGAALVEQWLSAVNTTIDPVLVRQYMVHYIFPTTPDRQPDRTRIDAALKPMQRCIDVLDGAVSSTGHLVGSAFTLADMNIMPILFYARRFPESRAMIDAKPALLAYVKTHEARPSVAAHKPPPMPKG